MTNIATKVVLIEKINNDIPYSKLQIVKEAWNNGDHPKECVGACKLQGGVFSTTCSVCGWDSY